MNVKDYLTLQEAAEKWGISPRRIQVLCVNGRIPGAARFGSAWAIPVNTEKPSDARVLSGNRKKAKRGIVLEGYSQVVGTFF